MKKLICLIAVFGLIIISSQAQEVSKIKTDSVRIAKNTIIKVKDGANPDVYINGKKVDHEILDLIDPNKIDRIEVLKGESAMQKYNAENVIIITTKKASDESKVTVRIVDNSGSNDTGEMPIIIIDGKVTDRKTFEKISPDDIESINVMKDKATLAKYKTNIGVIFISMKKKE